VAVLVGAAVVAVLVVPSVYARGQAAPVNTALPTVSFPPGVGNILTPTQGSWSNSPTSFTYQWLNCPRDGGAADGSNCVALGAPDPTAFPQLLYNDDLGEVWRTRVTATNASGSASAVSPATQPVANLALNITGCPGDEAGTIHVNTLLPAARLIIYRVSMTPSVVTRTTQRITLRIDVVACDHQSVLGARVSATPTPFNQFTGPEGVTNSEGRATLTLTRQRGFPAALHQRNLIVFVRAHKAGEAEDILGGISNRRLVSLPVRL
jgi:hypothetical protein